MHEIPQSHRPFRSSNRPRLEAWLWPAAHSGAKSANRRGWYRYRGRYRFRNRCDMALHPEAHGFTMRSNPDPDAYPEDAPLFLPMAEQNKRPAGTAEPFRVARPEAWFQVSMRILAAITPPEAIRKMLIRPGLPSGPRRPLRQQGIPCPVRGTTLRHPASLQKSTF
jgi:hypothetical protein